MATLRKLVINKLLGIVTIMFLARMLLSSANYEFRWMWANIAADLALPLYLLIILLFLSVKLKYVILRVTTGLIIIFGALWAGGSYLFSGRSGNAEHSFRSPSGRNIVIVKETSVLFRGDIDFYEPKFFILKKQFLPAFDGADDGGMPFTGGQYSVEWNKAETECTLRWEFDYLSKHWNSRTIKFDQPRP